MLHNRRTLHQPFFPPSTPSPPPFPKYPFSADPSPPFFPDSPSLPPPPPSSSSSSLPTFPANISSLTFPNPSSQNAPHRSHSKLLPAVLFSLVALSLLVLSLTFLFHRRRRQPALHPEPDKPAPAPAPAPATSAPAPAADFLYLGTIVDSRTNQGQVHGDHHSSNAAAAAAAKLGSPELRPLPPLSRKFRPNYGNANGSDDEFYSPKRNFEAVEDKCGSRSSDLSSYPDSDSAGSSPAKDSRSGAPPPQLKTTTRPMTPSPPKRKPPSPSPPSSPAAVRSDANLIGFEFSGQNLRNQPPAGPPPPPPPPPPVGYWEGRVRKPPISTMARKCDALENNEETPRLKLKPLHWDKVRASSDRAMVWDQLKSSSFQ